MSKDLNILQINLNRSPIATEAALELALELKIGLVCDSLAAVSHTKGGSSQ